MFFLRLLIVRFFFTKLMSSPLAKKGGLLYNVQWYELWLSETYRNNTYRINHFDRRKQ